MEDSLREPDEEQGKPAEPLDPLFGLLEGVRAGNAVAVRALLSALAPEITRISRAVLGGGAPADLDDVVQESLIGVMNALPGFRGECRVRGFANRIAVRTALHARRRARVRQQRQAGLTAEDWPGPAARPVDEQHMAAQRLALLCKLLDHLPDVQAETLALRVVLGLSLEETAAATSSTVNTVRSRVRVAREALRARIEREPGLREWLEAKS